jgi:hypothetical protein
VEPRSKLARYAYGYSDEKPGWLFWAIHVGMIAFIIWTFATSPAPACHRFSIWKYPFAQPRCGVTVDRSWYVEVTPPAVEPVKPAQEPDQRTPDQIQESREHDEMVRENKDYLNALMKLLRQSEGKQ